MIRLRGVIGMICAAAAVEFVWSEWRKERTWWAQFHRQQKLYWAEMAAEEAEERRLAEDEGSLNGERDPKVPAGFGEWWGCFHGVHDPHATEACGKSVYVRWEVDGYESCYEVLCSAHSPTGVPGLFLTAIGEETFYGNREEEAGQCRN